jgi:hypothetical protein
MSLVDSPKFFSESEVGDLIRRAAELQEEHAEIAYTPGVTSEEMRRIAGEVGIDPRFLEKAIQERTQTPQNPDKLVTIEKVLPVELDPENFDAITEKIEPVHSSNPKTGTSIMTQIGRSMQGQVRAGWSNPHIKVTSREGRTKMTVRVDPSIAVAAAMAWSVPMMASPALGASGNPILAGLAAAACAVSAFFTYKWAIRKANKATREAADKIESAIMESGTGVRENLESATVVPTEETQSMTQKT